MKTSTNYLKKICRWLLPYTCILCSRPSTLSQDLCVDCFNELPNIILACQRCAKSLSFRERQLICQECLKQAPPFDYTYALYFYKPPVTKLIMDLKFGEALVNARILGELLAEKILEDWYQNKLLPEVIIPVPLHHERLKERGFNQALEIARPIRRILNLPIEYTRCQRIKATKAQATLPAKERLQNIKNAFRIMGNLPCRHVAVVDDVMTTGHTMIEFCRTLKEAGIRQIDVWCLARPEF